MFDDATSNLDASPVGVAAATWGIKHLLIGLFGVVGLLLVFLATIALPVEALTNKDAPEALLAQAVATGLWDISMVLFVFWLVRRTGGSWRNLGLRPPRSVSGSKLSLPSFFGLIILANIGMRVAVVVYTLVLQVAGLDELLPEQQIPDAFFDYGFVLAVFALMGVTLVPIAEETFFRGFLFGGLRRRLPFIVSGLISGIIFSIAHGQIGLIVPFTVIGLILAYLYERTGSIATPIGAHFLFNAISFLALIFIPDVRN